MKIYITVYSLFFNKEQQDCFYTVHTHKLFTGKKLNAGFITEV